MKSLPNRLPRIIPGDPLASFGKTMDNYIELVGLKGVANRTGYDIAISIPYDWVGHIRIFSPGGFE